MTTLYILFPLSAVLERRQFVRSISSSLVLPAAILSSRAVHAEYGEGARQAPPALVPSPFRPTGLMADTCEVVALGREDVCLEYKKVLTACVCPRPILSPTSLPSLKHAAALCERSLRALLSTVIDDSMLLERATDALEDSDLPEATELLKLISLVKASDWEGLSLELERVPNSNNKALVSACKKRDSQAAVKAVVSLVRSFTK